MKGLTMLKVVINALVQQEEMVTVITCFYNVFEFTEFPTGMCTTPNSSTKQGPWLRTLIHVMYIRHIMSSILFTWRNAQGEMRALGCPLQSTARQHTVQNKERQISSFIHLRQITVLQQFQLINWTLGSACSELNISL